MSKVMAVGDVNSDAKGSGARDNAGKPQTDLVPVRFWRDTLTPSLLHKDGTDGFVIYALHCLTRFQEGHDDSIVNFFKGLEPHMLEGAVPVFEFGAKKYAEWNWAKGMDWSVPTGCIIRHAIKIAAGEAVDAESGERHSGHIMCNMVMLGWFAQFYPEGDNRPPS
jgi:hypothetical protein